MIVRQMWCRIHYCAGVGSRLHLFASSSPHALLYTAHNLCRASVSGASSALPLLLRSVLRCRSVRPLSNRPPCNTRRTLWRRGQTKTAQSTSSAEPQDHPSTSAPPSSADVGDDFDASTALLTDDDGLDVLARRLDTANSGQRRVMLVQPQLKWTPSSCDDVSPDTSSALRQLRRRRLLDEAVSLITSLPEWYMCCRPLVYNVISSTMFAVLGPGQLTDAAAAARRLAATDIVLNVSRLAAAQCCHLETAFDGRRVWDRYSLVLAIFRRHAVSSASRLHVALAELPYLRTRLRVTGQYTAERAAALDSRAVRLHAVLRRCRRHETSARQLRRSTDVPTVGVVGYTNAGKTSLIAALSGSRRAVGRRQVFATLDVTAHRSVRQRYHSQRQGLVGGGKETEVFSQQVRHVYLDTIGFMLELPTALLDGFRATLQEVSCAQLLVHVVDVSQPDWRRQMRHVELTLRQLGLPQQLLDNRLLVGNKCDLLAPQSACDSHSASDATANCSLGQSSSDSLPNRSDIFASPDSHRLWQRWTRMCDGEESASPDCEDGDDEASDMMLVSAGDGGGMARLFDEVQLRLLLVTGRQLVEVSVPTGSPSYSWMLQHMHVLELRQLPLPPTSSTSEGCQMTLFSLAASESELASLRRNCPSLRVMSR